MPDERNAMTASETKQSTEMTPHEEPEKADCSMGGEELDPETCRFYREALVIMEKAGIPFLVGGAYALQRYTGISRHTKDFDIFVRPTDAQRALKAFEDA